LLSVFCITCVQMVGIAPFDEQNLKRSQFLAEAYHSVTTSFE